MQKGQSLTEYSLAIALIAVACIGGLIVFSGDLSGGLKITRGYLGIPDAGVKVADIPGGEAAEKKTSILDDPDSIESISLSVDPVTGELIYQISRNGGAGTQVTSEEGGAVTILLAQRLGKLANTTIGAEPLPTKISNLIKRLSATGELLGGVSRRIEAMAGELSSMQQHSSGAYPAPLVSTGLTYSEIYLNFADIYNALKDEVYDTYPRGSAERNTLMRQINQLAGPISYIANKETGKIIFNKDFKMSRVDKSYVQKRQKNFPNAVQEMTNIQSTTPPTANTTNKKDQYFLHEVRVLGDQKQVGTPPTGEGMAIKLNGAASR